VTQSVHILDACRTPIGKAGGVLAATRPDDLTAQVLTNLVSRNPWLDPATVDEVFWGAANQAGEDNRNVARMGSLLAGLPVEVPGVTVNRLCGSGMQAVISAMHAMRAGEADLCLAGGVESMTRAPFVLPRAESAYPRTAEIADTRLGWRLVNPAMDELYPTISLGETAEIVAERHGIDRTRQDQLALTSHLRAAEAQRRGAFDDQMIAVVAGDGVITVDEGVRPDATLDGLARLRPVFRADGTVTAGNSSQLSDGAAGLLLATDSAVPAETRPLGRVLAGATVGVHPHVMGLGPIPAVRRLLARTGLTVADVDLWEINEAFASQAAAVIDELGLQEDRVNVNGGAIALGHPLGCSGARLVGALVHELRHRGDRYGVASMCIGVGQGIAVLVETDA
jgi:3-oxoadipyl-CoA thiolase